ncbi:MAG: hypothetical protein ACXAAT_00910 [Candidatus Hodarchaeales archaeon]
MKNENREIISMSAEEAQVMQEHEIGLALNWKTKSSDASEQSALLLERNLLNTAKSSLVSDTDVVKDGQHQPCENNKKTRGFVNPPRRTGLQYEFIFSKEAKTFNKGKMDDRKERAGKKQRLHLDKLGRLTIVFRSEEKKPNHAKNYDLISRNRRHSQVGSQKDLPPYCRSKTDCHLVVKPPDNGITRTRSVFEHNLSENPVVLVPPASTQVGQVGFIGDLTMSNTTTHPNEEGQKALLPDRVIGGLPEAEWPVVTEENAFKAVSLWEFTNLYVLLDKKDWLTLSKYLKGAQLSAISRDTGISPSILSNIRDSPEQSIVVPNLKRLCEEVEMDLSKVERSVKAVRSYKGGPFTYLKFPFVMDIYLWRLLCHIPGDGNVKYRKYPGLRWRQLHKNQGPMRKLLSRLSRKVGGKSDSIWFPNALSYAILGTMPGITFSDLRTPSFVQFVINLPPHYRDWKVQFLAAFIIDDGSIGEHISFTQKDERVLHSIMRLCDQLGYDHSIDYEAERDGVRNYQLRQEGIQSFAYDVAPLYASDPLLGLWHKHSKLLSVNVSFSPERKTHQNRSVFVCTTILQIFGDHNVYSTGDLWDHPKLQNYLQGEKHFFLPRRIELLHRKMGLIHEDLKNDETHYRPKRWYIPKTTTPELLIQKFHELYNNRAHAQSYKRRNITPEMVERAIEELKAQGIKPSALNVSRLLKCSKKQLYKRKDLRKFFIKDEE